MEINFSNIYFFNAFLAGLLGSFHCLGMCGPLLMTLPFKRNKDEKSNIFILKKSISYHGGRIFTYSLFGLILGFAGVSLGRAGIQNYLAIVIGVLLIIGVVLPVKNYLYIFFNYIYKKLSKQLKAFVSKNARPGYFTLGIFNGMLPCGLVYLALSGSLAAETSFEGALFMLFFGVGTLPMMMAVFLIGFNISENLKSKFSKISTVFIILFSLILIGRGIYFEYQNYQQKTLIECHP